MKKRNISYLWVCVLLYLYTMLAYSPLEFQALYTLVPAAFGLSIIASDNKYNVYMKLLFCLYGWILLSWTSAKYTDLATAQLHQILGCILFTVPVYHLAKKHKYVYWAYGMWILFYVVCVRFAMNNIMSISFNFAEERLSQESGGLDGNHFSQYTVFLTFILFIFGEFCDNLKYKKYLILSFWLIIPITFYVSIVTASRQVLLIGVPLIASLLYIRYLKGSSTRNKTQFLLIASVLALMLFARFASTYENSYLAQRNQESIEEDTRLTLLKNSFEVGWENPFLGVGPGNFCKYSFNGYNAAHNSFGEIFANSGFPALIIYVAMLWIFINRQRKRYRYSQDKRYLMFLIFGLFYTIDNFFMSFHTSPRLICFFILLATHAELYYKEEMNKKYLIK